MCSQGWSHFVCGLSAHYGLHFFTLSRRVLRLYSSISRTRVASNRSAKRRGSLWCISWLCISYWYLLQRDETHSYGRFDGKMASSSRQSFLLSLLTKKSFLLSLLTKKSLSSVLCVWFFLPLISFSLLFYRFFGVFCAWPDDDYKDILQMYGCRIESQCYAGFSVFWALEHVHKITFCLFIYLPIHTIC
jgi:hypothetical protein